MLAAKTLKNTSLTFDNLGTVTTNQTLLLANGNVQELTLGASIAISAITGPGGAVACDLTLYIKQDVQRRAVHHHLLAGVGHLARRQRTHDPVGAPAR